MTSSKKSPLPSILSLVPPHCGQWSSELPPSATHPYPPRDFLPTAKFCY